MASVTNRAEKVPVLEIDLSSGKVEKHDLGKDVRRKYLGSRGVNSRILYDRVGPETDALSPESVLIFGTGVMDGVGVPAGARLSITGKSPASVFGYSNVGGYFPGEMRKAGYDHIIIKGKAEKPVFLWIDNDKVEIRPAAHLWGRGVFETDRLVKEELGDPDIKVGTIGLAGENQVSMANIVFETKRAGGSRMGGQIMASKNLKAIAVRGSGEIGLADKQRVRDLSRDLIKRIKENPMCISRSTGGGAHTQGITCAFGSAPIKNLTTSVFHEIAGVAPENITKHYTKSNAGCPGCPIHHHFSWEIKEGPYAGEKGVGLEGGVIMLWAGLVGNSYAPAVFAANRLCNDYGIDELETGMAISAAMEWLEKGIITKKDLGGVDLRFGNHAAVMEMIHRIAGRQGFGDLLAEGPVAAAEKLGKAAQECINYGKGRISAWLDWRVLKGGYLSEVTSSPACEMMDGWLGGWEILKTMGKVTPELSALGVARFGTADAFDQLSYSKARATVYSQDFAMVMDSLEICAFITEWMLACCTMKDAADLFHAVTGIDMGEEGLIKAAGRIRDLERAYWVREGYTRKDDRLEGKIMNEPVPDGPFKGAYLDRKEIEKMLDEFYQLRGWNVETGIPTKKKLLEDGLEDVVADLEKRGKL